VLHSVPEMALQYLLQALVLWFQMGFAQEHQVQVVLRELAVAQVVQEHQVQVVLQELVVAQVLQEHQVQVA